jgi:adenosine deaminase
MKKLIVLFSIIFFSALLYAQRDSSSIKEEETGNYLETIRNNDAFLRKFFQGMPKGGDLHHHYSGSVYAETYLKYVENQDMWINKETFEIYNQSPPGKERNVWSKVSSLKSDGLWENIKREIIKSWSIKYYNNYGLSSDEHFFSTFGNFDIPKGATYKEGLLEIKERAKKENTRYIETMFNSIRFDKSFDFEKGYDLILLNMQEVRNNHIQDTLSKLFEKYIADKSYEDVVTDYNNTIKNQHEELKIDDDVFKMRYQNYVYRITNPVNLFNLLLVSFESANKSNLIVGVNIVGCENNEIAMRDYWLHMQMFRFFHSKFPNVHYSLHAGELVLGLVKPEDLTWHIDEALFTASAQRIGHGVDIMYETNSEKILRFMQKNKIAIEINLTSNDFILGLSGNKHPVLIYDKYKVPIVICSDDAGVLRTDLTEQYVILAKNYPQISYKSIKRFVFNSIEYSFMDDNLKKELTEKVKKDFIQFESSVANSLNK